MNQRMRAGKGSELIVAGELTRRGLDVYLPCVDDQGIDLIVRVTNGERVQHFDIQVKSVAGYNRIIGVRLPAERRENYILLLHYRHEDRPDEFYYLTGQQAEQHLLVGSKFHDLIFNQAERGRYQGQDLAALATHLRGFSSRPGEREIQVQALRYVISNLGDAFRVSGPEWHELAREWTVAVFPHAGDLPVGEVSLDEWGKVITGRSSTFDSVRSSSNASRTSIPAA